MNGIKKIVLVLGFFLLAGKGYSADAAPVAFTLDTTNFVLSLNGKPLDKMKLEDFVNSIYSESRKLERPGKTLYIFDELGFTLIKDSKGVTVTFMFEPAKTEEDPKFSFAGSIVINGLSITRNTAVTDITGHLPKAQKTLSMDETFIYVNKEFVTMCESKKGSLRRLDFGFKIK